MGLTLAIMARETVTKLIDDLDGSADSSVSFALDGHYYTIDLNARHRAPRTGRRTVTDLASHKAR